MTLRLARPPDRFSEQSHGSIAPELSPLPRGRPGQPNAPAMRRSPGRGSGRRPSWSLARIGASTRRPCSAPYRVSCSVVPNVAGLVPTYRPDAGAHGTSAALEYGVRAHEGCADRRARPCPVRGVRAMVEGAPEARDFRRALDDDRRECPAKSPDPRRAGRHSEPPRDRPWLAPLAGATFPRIAEAVAAGRLTVHGLRFDIHTGVLAMVAEG
jgi:hypothetical protein